MSIKLSGLVVVILVLSACDRVGSDAWCESQKQRPKGDWTIDETSQYTKYCVFGLDSEKWCKKLEKKPKGEWTANEGIEYASSCVFDRDES
jgi:hypothetical protein